MAQLVDDVRSVLRASHSAVEACRNTVAALRRHSPALISVVLHVRENLRCVAATGSWQVYSSTPLNAGVAGRVYASGEPAVITNVDEDPDFIPLGPDVAVEICVPVLDRIGQPIGALNAEWTAVPGTRDDLESWRDTLAEVGRALGHRVDEMGGPPPESLSEQMLRHALALTAAATEAELLDLACRASREVTGLAACVVLRIDDAGDSVGAGSRGGPLPARLAAAGAGPVIAPRSPEVVLVASSPEPRDRPLVSRLGTTAPAQLYSLIERTARHGSSYTIGDPEELDAHGYETLTDAGVRTMISVPLGADARGGVLVAVDDSVAPPLPAVVNLLELLAAQVATCLDRIATLQRLRHQASSDPLTGLQHSRPFGQRLAESVPGRTALLALDVDGLKQINDTYGHAAGNRALIELARVLQNELRHGDELFRIGGDEFCAVIDVPSVAEALVVADRLAGAARLTGHTISVGVALRRTGEAADEALHRADLALYEVKRAGRNGVKVAD